MRIPVVVLIFLAAATATAQWQLQDSHSNASFRGVHSLGGGVAWVSGTEGTVLRTEDGGVTWQHCAVPPGAEKLDFRGVQGFDAKTAIVMSSGKGDLSRLYKTTDGCQTWKLLYSNPDAEGFWDAIGFMSRDHGFLLGDPVPTNGERKAHIFLQETSDGGVHWKDWHDHPGTLVPTGDTAIFAASNSSMVIAADGVIFGTGGAYRASIFHVARHFNMICNCVPPPTEKEKDGVAVAAEGEPMAFGDSAGIFSIAQAPAGLMLVGGDYTKPDSTYENALFLRHGSIPISPVTPPHGYRSAVAYYSSAKTWITVGPNGTDISTDDGRNWRALKPGPNDVPDVDKNWNALSLPFVVGPHGRIGVLRPSAISVNP